MKSRSLALLVDEKVLEPIMENAVRIWPDHSTVDRTVLQKGKDATGG